MKERLERKLGVEHMAHGNMGKVESDKPAERSRTICAALQAEDRGEGIAGEE